jgi:hypothetical protein
MLRRSTATVGDSAPPRSLGPIGPSDADIVISEVVLNVGATARASSGPGGATAGEVGGDFARELGQSRGRPIPDTVRNRLEPAFQADFRGVRIHTDELAAKLAARINAFAFTLGQDIYFGRGRYAPETPTGFALLGHELTHVVQNQGGSGTIRTKALDDGRPVRRKSIGLGPSLARSASAHLATRGALTVAGQDSQERQALANEKLFGGRSMIRRKEGDSRTATLNWIGDEAGARPMTDMINDLLDAQEEARRRPLIRDARSFQADIKSAMQRFGKVDLDDPQDYSPGNWADVIGMAGVSHMNRSNQGGNATSALELWFLFQVLQPGEVGGTNDPDRNLLNREKTTYDDVQKLDRRFGIEAKLFDQDEKVPGAAGKGHITQEDFIYKAIVANDGNVPLALASCAEVLYRPYNRRLAARILGLPHDGKDYYRFTGAFVGIQQSAAVRAGGLLGSDINILMNPLAGIGAGLKNAAVAKWQGKDPQKSLDSAYGYAFQQATPTVQKALEFDAGLMAGFGVRLEKDYPRLGLLYRTGLTLAQHWTDDADEMVQKRSAVLSIGANDASEQLALANERALLSGASGGSVTPVPAGPVRPRAIIRRRIAGDVPALRLGSRGDDVTRLQEKLKAHGYAVPVDGVFSDSTDKAVRAFQQKSGLTVDGRVGPGTWHALDTSPDAGGKDSPVTGSLARLSVGLAKLPDSDFGEVVDAMGPSAFAKFVWDGSTVQSPTLWERFKKYASGSVSIDPERKKAPGYHVALELQSISDAKGGNGAERVDGAAGRAEKQEESSPYLANLASSGDLSATFLKYRFLLKKEWLTKIKEVHELLEIWQSHDRISHLSPVELWAWVREMDAETFEQRILKSADSEQVLKNLGKLFSTESAPFNRRRAEGMYRALLKPAKAGETRTLAHVVDETSGVSKRYRKIVRALPEAKEIKEGKGFFGSIADKVLEKARKMLEPFERLLHGAEDMVKDFAREDGLFSKVVREALELGSKVKDAFSGFFSGAKNAFRFLKEAAQGVLDFLKPLLESKIVKSITQSFGRVMKTLPWVALAGDLAGWAAGSNELKEKAEKQELPTVKKYLEQGGMSADFVMADYYGFAVATDVVSLIGTLVSPGPQLPIAMAASLAADAANLAWTGLAVGGEWTKRLGAKLHWHWLESHGVSWEWGGFGLPILNWQLRGDGEGRDVQRKRRGFSRFDDDDPELRRIHADVVDRYQTGPGVSLDLSTKYRLERILGREIGEVRLHSGLVATKLAQETEAEAVTTGRDVYMPAGKLDTLSPEGIGLLAHEVTHTIQAGPATPTATPRSLGGGSTGEVLERVAHAIERRVVASARTASYPVVEAVVREAPAAAPVIPPPAAPVVVRESAPAVATPAAAPAAVSRSVAGDVSTTFEDDATEELEMLGPVETIMTQYAVTPAIPQEEFLAIVTDRIMELMREELLMDAERNGTLSFDESLPQS